MANNYDRFAPLLADVPVSLIAGCDLIRKPLRFGMCACRADAQSLPLYTSNSMSVTAENMTTQYMQRYSCTQPTVTAG